ncbi:adenine phosphoribosyltransferase [Peptoniphilus asaccharolyticus DSM 20463]|uniref:Adenine phosphoribosyltransferase n=1 Tax=Peptoniphilus asaccharolyticus DSM 20463 TaxID=573058 RepID=A0A1W1VC92_PEPAS|nr:adenine phosphoribosyltransferase [Peptoniphilus asaccharolyticus]MBL7575610.1 adenine phosphoribosyltransferase [Peptoniphilus asaccharolyticus]SMB90988.1 adenine phosphoribosyltransferase [Peptoniphilus asaccharolyticus DSM 20463]
MDLRDKIRALKDYPSEGIIFRDITTLLKEADGFKAAIDQISDLRDDEVDVVVGIEARGFIVGAPIAYKKNCGFVPVRKPGKLPAETISKEYALEYGIDKIEMHKDAIKEGSRVLIVDDLLATGGTSKAAVELIESLGGIVVGLDFLIELEGLPGREALKGYDVRSVIKY